MCPYIVYGLNVTGNLAITHSTAKLILHYIEICNVLGEQIVKQNLGMRDAGEWNEITRALRVEHDRQIG